VTRRFSWSKVRPPLSRENGVISGSLSQVL
jgi:hypothetical protein